MAFWSANDVKPKRNFRFLVQFSGLGDDTIPSQLQSTGFLWWAKSVTTPSYEVTETPHDHLDNKYYFPGRVVWSPVSLVLVDPVDPDVVGQTNALIEAMGYTVPGDGSTNFKTMSKTNASVGDVIISILDSEGVTLEKWTLQNSFVKSVKFGDLAYDNDELRTISLDIRYDWAQCDIKPDNADASLSQFPSVSN
jgi:hypothetical protein